MKDLISPLPEKQEEYRILRHYDENIIRCEYSLQIKTKFLWWKYWKTIKTTNFEYIANEWLNSLK